MSTTTMIPVFGAFAPDQCAYADVDAGMTCVSCTNAVERALLATPGVLTAQCDLATNNVSIQFDAASVSQAQLKNIIEDVGFDTTELVTENAMTEAEPFLPMSEPLANGTKPPTRRASLVDASRLTTTYLSVEGMTCGACTAAIESQVNPMKVPGLATFSIALISERAAATHDATVISATDIAELIEDCGFDARVISSEVAFSQLASGPDHKLGDVTLKIFGMNCASCVGKIEAGLLRLEGVESAMVNLSLQQAKVVYRVSSIGVRDLVDTVVSLGFDALLADVNDNAAQLESLARTRETQEWRAAFWRAFMFSLPVFILNKILPQFAVGRMFFDFTLLIPGLHLGDVLSLVLTIPVQFGIGSRFYKVAYNSLRHGSATMDVLVCLGTTAAFVFSVLSMLVALMSEYHPAASTFFDTSGMLITFVTFGRYLENKAKGSTSAALSRLMSLAPSSATIYADPNGLEKSSEEKSVPTELLQAGDIVLLKPGGKIPADGVVIAGQSFVDESMITGEARAVLKQKGDLVVAGTINGLGRLDFRVQRAGKDTQLSQIVRVVQEAQTTKAPIQRFSDTVAGFFVPTVITLGLLTFFGWMILSHVLHNPPQIFLHADMGGKTMTCLKLCISVIVVACPCALGLATPTAVMVGTGMAASHGILIKGGAVLETATKSTRVVFDKTGTLTFGEMSAYQHFIDSEWLSQNSTSLWWTLISTAEQNSEHPTARALVDRAKVELCLPGARILSATTMAFEAKAGYGISCTIEVEELSFEVVIGNAEFLQQHEVQVLDHQQVIVKRQNEGETCVFISINGIYAGMISLSDRVKEDASKTIAALKRMGKEVAMVTGDQRNTALRIAKEVGISSECVWAGITPTGKKDLIERMQKDGDIVVFVGDGINDSPGLATANVGIAMSSGTDVAIEAADIVLMRNGSIIDVPAALLMSDSIFARIKLNLLWACLYNLVAIPFAMGFFLPFGLHLHPMIAGGAMAMSSVSVVCSSLLLKYWQKPIWLRDDTNSTDVDFPAKRSIRLPFPFRRAWEPVGAQEMRAMPIL